jgi:UDP-glucose 4-epimerase
MIESVLVTGGAGFIGSHLCELLLRQGRRVRVLDNCITGKRDNLAHLRPQLEFVDGSATDAAVVAAAMAGIGAVVHLAALPSVSRSLEQPLDTHHACATSTVNILAAAKQQRARVIYAGSSSAYGNQDARVKQESMREDPLSPYAAAKLAGELYCRAFARVYDLPVVVTRFFNVFGPRQVPDSPYSGVVAAFCFALLRRQAPRIDGDGQQSRDFTYVEDAVAGVANAIDANTSGCEIVNLAYGQSITVLEMYEQLARIAGHRVEPKWAPPRKGDVRHSLADISRARALLGFSASIGLAEGLRRTFDWYRSQYA